MASLWESAAGAGTAGTGIFHGRTGSISVAELTTTSTLGSALELLRGRSVLITAHEQLAAAIALLELDGVARRLVVCTPDLTPEQLAEVAATGEVDALVHDGDAPPTLAALPSYELAPRPLPAAVARVSTSATEWILLTSGTTGRPKLVVHTLDSLAGTLPRQAPPGSRCVWSTFYDIRRYGGMQIYLRAVLSGAPLVLSSPADATRDFLLRAGAAGVTHISGTPSHWRRTLMSGAAGLIQPSYVRLSGEIADQAILDSLQAAYPQARVAHAFASTEAGVAFDVNDGRAGFPAELVDRPQGAIDMKVVDGTLRIRSQRNAARYLGATPAALVGTDGYVDTGDMVELLDGRYHFRGRVGGVINVGGLKVHPEEVESVLNGDPRVRMSLVRARRNPITGAIVVADVVLADPDALARAPEATEHIKAELLGACRQALAAHKVPTTLRFVPALELTAAGKLVRPGA